MVKQLYPLKFIEEEYILEPCYKIVPNKMVVDIKWF